jgi:hypothetical protein
MAQPMQKWMQIADSIFTKNREKYETFSDKDKEDVFYIINKKFYLGNPALSQFFNHKSIDKSTAIDLWFLYFEKNPKYKNLKSAPGWYWSKSTNTKETVTKTKKTDKEMLMEYEGLSEEEFDFLYEHYKDDIDYKIKLLNRLD